MKIKPQEVFIIKGSDFEDLIKKHLGKQYDFNEDQDIQKGDFKKYEIKSLTLKNHQKEYLQNFLNNGELSGYPGPDGLTSALIVTLINKGILEKGIYFIESYDY